MRSQNNLGSALVVLGIDPLQIPAWGRVYRRRWRLGGDPCVDVSRAHLEAKRQLVSLDLVVLEWGGWPRPCADMLGTERKRS